MNQVNLNDARNKRHSKMMSDEEKKEILNYLKGHSNDKKAISYLMKKHNCSHTTIGIIVVQDELKKEEEEEKND